MLKVESKTPNGNSRNLMKVINAFDSRYRAIVMVFLVSCTACKTTSTQQNDSIANLDWGITRADLEDDFQTKGQFQFRVIHDGVPYECLSFAFIREHNEYFFLFRNDSLISIHQPKEFKKYEVKEIEGKRRSIELPWNTGDRVRQVLESEGMAIDAFQRDLAEFTDQDRSSGRESLNLWPVSLGSTPFVPLAAIGNSKQKKKHEQWKKHFDPEGAVLGANELEVIRLYGKPTFKKTLDNKTIVSFGPDETFWSRDPEKTQLQGGAKKFWISVASVEGYIVGIFSDDFFNQDELVRYDYLAEN